MQESGRDFISRSMPTIHWKDYEKPGRSVRIDRLRDEIWTRYFPHSKRECIDFAIQNSFTSYLHIPSVSEETVFSYIAHRKHSPSIVAWRRQHRKHVSRVRRRVHWSVTSIRFGADDTENTASSTVASWTVFTELLPENPLQYYHNYTTVQDTDVRAHYKWKNLF
jgi:hypothetical protein